MKKRLLMVKIYRKKEQFSLSKFHETGTVSYSKYQVRHSSIYTVNVGTHKNTVESKNHVNGGYLVVLTGRKIG